MILRENCPFCVLARGYTTVQLVIKLSARWRVRSFAALWIYIYLYIYIYIYVDEYIYIFIYLFIYIHTEREIYIYQSAPVYIKDTYIYIDVFLSSFCMELEAGVIAKEVAIKNATDSWNRNMYFLHFSMLGNSGNPPGGSGDSRDRFYIDKKNWDFFNIFLIFLIVPS